MKYKIIVGVVAVVVIGGGYAVWHYENENLTTCVGTDCDAYPVKQACTQEAKQCPDGSYVSRTGPDCAFAACPTATNQTASSTAPIIPKNNTSDLAPQQTSLEIELGFSQGLEGGTGYDLQGNVLVYSYWSPRGNGNATTTLNNAQMQSLENILSRYNLATIQSDGLPVPDGYETTLDIATDGLQYSYHFLSSDNLGNKLANDLQTFFNTISSSVTAAPCGPTEDCNTPVVEPATAPIQATVSDSCAPWDGEALAI